MFENKILNEVWREVEKSHYLLKGVKEEVRVILDYVNMLNPLPEEKHLGKRIIITDEIMRIIAVRIDPAFYDVELDRADKEKKEFLRKLKLILEDIFEKPDVDKEAVLNNALKEMNKSINAFEDVVNRMKYEMGKIIYKADDPWDDRAVNPELQGAGEKGQGCCVNCKSVPKLLDQAQQDKDSFYQGYKENETIGSDFPPQETGTDIISGGLFENE